MYVQDILDEVKEKQVKIENLQDAIDTLDEVSRNSTEIPANFVRICALCVLQVDDDDEESVK